MLPVSNFFLAKINFLAVYHVYRIEEFSDLRPRFSKTVIEGSTYLTLKTIQSSGSLYSDESKETKLVESKNHKLKLEKEKRICD